ncbi:Uncharacterized protein HZ326_27732 [Fusarium oxysporum f. sp. albedinis]|nr:Uncharacterized protein HZ326_27732 [Fusarium oxysporum f. sp. albedinis]
MMSYLDWDRAENDRVEQNVEIEMAEQPFSRRRGMQDIWDAAERDIMLQESAPSVVQVWLPAYACRSGEAPRRVPMGPQFRVAND